MNPKIGVVDVGGGYRGVYAAGVLDYCMHKGIWFDIGIGVSAGCANIASFCAKQPLRNHKFYIDYGLRKEYASLRNYLRNKSYINLEYIYGTLSNSDGESPLDYETMMENPMDFLTVITDAKTGKVRYIPKQDLVKDQYIPFMASSAIPSICRPVIYEDVPYYDGALGDPIPIQKAFSLGCEKVVLILTLPEDTVRSSQKDEKLARRIRREFPAAADALVDRARKYNAGIELAKQYQAEGKLLIIAPEDTCGVHTICKDGFKMRQLYGQGYVNGEKIIPFILE